MRFPSLRGLSHPQAIAAVAAWVQGLYRKGEKVPVLVGGAAVELYTGGAYTTGDLDFVGEVTARVAERLGAAGFEREGRHWIHRGEEVFLEFPAAALDENARTALIAVGRRKILVLAPEEILLDRLASWWFWRSEVDAVNGFLLWRNVHENLDRGRLRAQAKRQGLEEPLQRLERFARGLWGREPSQAQLEKWSKARR